MYHPTTRVLTVLELLQAHGSMGGAELAARMEVDRRTVRRYILMLQEIGIPIESTRGPGGGYQLRPGFKLPPLMLTDEEALAILLSLLAARRQGIPAATHTIEGALAKIERVLPKPLRLRLQAVEAAVTFVAQPTVAGPPVAQPAGELLLLISTAVQQQRRLRLRYLSSGQESVRAVDPYGVAYHWQNWYLAGWCHLRRGVRVFRFDRMIEATLDEAVKDEEGAEGATFMRPPDFDTLAVILDSLASAPAGWKVEVLLETTLAQAQAVIPPGSATFEEVRAGDVGERGVGERGVGERGVIMHGYSDNLDRLARQLLTLQCPMVIRQPNALRTAMAAVAAEAAAIAAR